MAGTIVKPCDCKNQFQDEVYSRGNRLHNITADSKKASCTVCEGGAKYAKRNSKSTPPTTNRSSKAI